MLFRFFIATTALIALAVNGHDASQGEHRQLAKRLLHSKDVTSEFQSCQNKVSNYGPSFENACQNRHPEVLVKGLVDIRTSIVSLSAHVNVGVDVWVSADLHVYANLYVGLLARIQILLEIIHSHGLTDSCKDSILALNAPLKALVTVFLKANIDIGVLLGVHVNLDLLAEIGISIGIQVGVGVHADLGVGVGVGAGAGDYA